MASTISFVLDGRTTTVEFGHSSIYSPTTTVLNYLRSLPEHKGVKEGCGQGDCGACTVVLAEAGPAGRLLYRSVDSCLVFLPMLHRKQLITVENLRHPNGDLHPVQRALVDLHGSQCGFCTPGIVMSLFALYKNHPRPDRTTIEDAFAGNLCRCTGYQPIIAAAQRACAEGNADQFNKGEEATLALLNSIPRDSLRLESAETMYYRPAALSEALALKANHPAGIVVTGGTDIALRVTKNHDVLPEVIDLSALDEMKLIAEDAFSISIGAGAPLNDVMPRIHDVFPSLHRMLSVFGSQQIRNMATFGGNLGTASPIGDALPVLVALGTTVELSSITGSRRVPMQHYFTGYRTTVRRPNEIVTAVILPKPASNSITRSYKISKRRELDISTVSGGFSLRLNERREVESIVLAFGGMADRVKRAETVENFLAGRKWNRETVDEASSLIERECNPISDARASAEMRRIAARNLLLKFWCETEGLEADVESVVQ